jgi:hypothetical protein
MYSKKTIAGIISVIILMFVFGSCSLDTKTIEPYLIEVDSIIAPDTVNPKTIFDIRLLGIIGPSSCFSLEKVYVFVTDQKEIQIEVRGRYQYEGVACAEAAVLLDKTVETNVPTTGEYMIKVLKQNYTYLEKKLIAR